MQQLKALMARLRALFRRETVLGDIEEELRIHVEMETETNLKRGMQPEEARLAALKSVGDRGRNADLAYDVRGGGGLETLWQDLRYGGRMLVKHPGFTVIAALTLALGIGANITIFSVVNAILLRPLPYADADRLVFLWSEAPKQNIKERASAYDNISDWRRQNQSFEDLAFLDGTWSTLNGGDEPERIESATASANLFPLLGVAPALGRAYTSDEERQRLRVVVISHSLWRRRFASSPNVLGQTLEFDGGSSQIVGVMPERFQFPSKNVQFWWPAPPPLNSEMRQQRRGTGFLMVIGRLQREISIEQAQTEMNTIASRLEQAFPEANKDLRVKVVPFHLQLTGRNVRLALWILFGAVIFVLLIACTNVANLMLARGLAREREMGVRMALGAGRLRLIRQLLTESALLALLAGAAGLLIAKFGVRILVSFSPPNLPNLEKVGIDGVILAFTTVVSLLTGVVFGLAPALKISQSDPGAALKDGRSATGGVQGRRLSGLLVIAEFSLAVLLLSGAGLLLRSLMRLDAVDPGFQTDRVLLIQTTLPQNSGADQWRNFYQQALERIAALPGVESAGMINDFLTSTNPDGMVTIERDASGNSDPARLPLNRDPVSEGFFQTLRVPLLKGRFFNAQDHQGSIPVAIINETMMRRLWPSDDPLGKRLKLGAAQSPAPWLTVVGVVGDMRRQTLEQQSFAQIFYPHLQNPTRNMNLLIRASADPAQVAAAVRNEIRVVDKTVPLQQTAPLESLFAATTAQRRFQTWLLTLFSALALLLAAVGVYGLMRQSTELRAREIGVRLALGARPRDVLRLIIGQGMRLALYGAGIGLLAAFAFAQVMSGLLFEVAAADPMTFLAAPLVLLLAALFACYLPARRAARVDPMFALRRD